MAENLDLPRLMFKFLTMTSRIKKFFLLAVFAGLLVPFVTQASGLSDRSHQERSISFYNTHTNETISVTYWKDGRYIPAALENINRVLRDHRSGHSHQMSTDTLNLLHDMKLQIKRRNPSQDVVFHVISGYRSPETNAALRASGGGQAKKSRHMSGDAIDIRVPGVDTVELRNMAWCLQRGGVGYYKDSDFVHVDTHKVRHWNWKPKAGMCSNLNS